MKKLVFLFLFTILSVSGFSQEKNYIYCELVGEGKALSSKVNVRIDQGEEKADYLKDKNNKKITFNSMIEAINYMGKEGWEFVQAYAVPYNGGGIRYWLLRKTISKEELEQTVE